MFTEDEISEAEADNAVVRLVHLSPDAPTISHLSDQKKIFREDFAEKYPLRILIAEDYLVNQMLAEMILNKLGYQPKIAVNGLEVLEMIKQTQLDLILMDVEMPELDGLEATRKIREKADGANANITIIAMTANATNEHKAICLEAGMNDYVSKPIQPELLKKALKMAAKRLQHS